MSESSKPSEPITKINDNDIICGRRGLALKHPGNLAYRKVVGMNKELYATCLKNEKLRISKSIVAAMREVGGRFIERVDGKSSMTIDEKDEDGNPVVYRDIGDRRAVEKTSQALREGQPKLLRKLAEKQVRNMAFAASASAPQAPQPMVPPQLLAQTSAGSQSYHSAAALRALSERQALDRQVALASSYSRYPPSASAASSYMSRPDQASVTPPPANKAPEALPGLMSQFEKDLLLLALLRRANGRL